MMGAATAAQPAPYEDMGPDLLSQQPVEAAPQKKDPDWQTTFTYLERRLGSLRTWRWSAWSYWRVLAQFFLPFRYIWLVTANRMWRGGPLNDSIIDSTGQLAVRTCAGGMWTGLTSPSRPWFKIEPALQNFVLDDEAKEWMQDTQNRIYTVLHQSNFYDTMAQVFRDETVFGNAPVICQEDAADVVRFYNPAAGEYYIQLGARLDATTLLLEFTLTVEQIVEQFTLESCPDQVKSLWSDGSYDTEFVVCRIIEPNFEIPSRTGRNKGVKPVRGQFVYREIFWLKGIKSDGSLSRRGFYDQPFAVFQWYKVSNDAYARSPCMDALGDNKQVQLETRRKAEFIEKGVRPPMGADPAMKNEPASITPGGITYTSADGAKKGFWPLFEVHPQWLIALTADIDKVNQRIEKCLFVDLFMAISRMEGVQPRNQLELTQRNLERLQELGPVIDLNEKALSQLLKRVISIMMRRTVKNEEGQIVPMLKPLPDSLKNQPLKITYTSIMRMAQRAAESVAMKDVFQTGGVMSSAAKAAQLPDPLRVIDLDKSIRRYAELNDFPQDCVFSIEEVKEHDAAAQKGKQEAEMPGAAMAAVNAAKTMSETELPGGSLLNSLMSGSTLQQ